ncbi:hypothetical protein HDU96_007871 [Phlyctochytrium bullatum]|nr:hypothetical protein HDU96_007871 [Phlyctochytrium bullatum]
MSKGKDAARKKEKRAVDARVEQSLRPPQQPANKLTPEELERRREQVKRKLLNSGVALPNSVVKKEASAEPKSAISRRGTAFKPFNPIASHVTSLQKGALPTGPITSIEEEKAQKAPAKQTLASLVKKLTNAPPPVEVPPPLQKYVVPANRSRGNKPVKYYKTPDPEDVLPVRDYDIFRRESEASEGLGARMSHYDPGLLEDIDDTDEIENTRDQRTVEAHALANQSTGDQVTTKEEPRREEQRPVESDVQVKVTVKPRPMSVTKRHSVKNDRVLERPQEPKSSHTVIIPNQMNFGKGR